jgi:hypothetical protein
MQWRKTAFPKNVAWKPRQPWPQINLDPHFRPYTKNFKMDHTSKYKTENIKLIDERKWTKSLWHYTGKTFLNNDTKT